MRVCAVICEYNPFPLGHAYHLRAAREASGAYYAVSYTHLYIAVPAPCQYLF